jgi:dipeptidyl-peptidase 4
VAAVRSGELHVIDLAAAKERQITFGASETLTHGLAEFVAQEEMGRFSGYWWSPDSEWIAHQETDQSSVERRYIANPLRPEKEPEWSFYPRAGTPNVKVRLGIVGRTGTFKTWIKWDTEKYPYLGRVVWSRGSPLTLLLQTREQQEQKLLTVHLETGEAHDLLIETDEAWLNLDESGLTPFWIKDGTPFLWATERRRSWQIELRRGDGALIRELTPPGFGYRELVHVDESRKIAIVAGGEDPRETHLFRVSLDGGQSVKMTEARGYHRATFSKNGGVYVHAFNLVDGRVGADVRGWDGKLLARIPSVAEPIPRLPEIELQQVGKARTLEAVVIRPPDFQKGRKYPVILEAYAGPLSGVVRALPRSYLTSQWRADHGYIVVLLDGRGTPWRSRKWERTIRGKLIEVALEDQIAGLQALGEELPEMDLSRVGVAGWSFGGYFSAMATIRRPDIIRCGVAGAPVIDWEDYDTHYTERYLGLPSRYPEAYRKSSVLTYASQVEHPLLIVHGVTDDNVYFQHSLKFAHALL